jgi:hypothetical protein
MKWQGKKAQKNFNIMAKKLLKFCETRDLARNPRVVPNKFRFRRFRDLNQFGIPQMKVVLAPGIS